jgi:carboxymethylenebutenolidase
MIVIQHAPGVDEFVQTMTDRLAEAGYEAIAPDLYHRSSFKESDDPLSKLKTLRDVNVIKDVNAAIDLLKSRGDVDRNNIGIVGFCMGGRVAYLMAIHNPELKTAVVFYGGNIMAPWGDEVPAPYEESFKIRCPILGLFGQDDSNPSPDDVLKLDKALSHVNHEFHTYAGAGHAFMNYQRDSYREAAASDAWKKTLEWLESRIPRSKPPSEAVS